MSYPDTITLPYFDVHETVFGLEAVEKRYSDLVSKYVGDSEKAIAAAFQEAADARAFLILDERAFGIIDEIKPLGELADTALSVLAWTRQTTGLAGHRALARLIDQLVRLRSLAIDPSIVERIHTDRRRILMREGTRLSAQHLKMLAPLRRCAILAVTVLESITRLTDEVIGMFDRLIGGLFRRAERRAAEALQANARAVNDKVRLLVKLGDALIEARRTGSDAFAAIETVLPWDRFAAAVAEAKKLSRTDGPDYAALAAANHAVLRRELRLRGRRQRRTPPGGATVGSRGPKGLSGGDEDVSQRPLTLMHLKLDTSEEPPPTAVGNTRQPRGSCTSPLLNRTNDETDLRAAQRSSRNL